jgi:hypothetical protein
MRGCHFRGGTTSKLLSHQGLFFFDGLRTKTGVRPYAGMPSPWGALAIK